MQMRRQQVRRGVASVRAASREGEAVRVVQVDLEVKKAVLVVAALLVATAAAKAAQVDCGAELQAELQEVVAVAAAMGARDPAAANRTARLRRFLRCRSHACVG